MTRNSAYLATGARFLVGTIFVAIAAVGFGLPSLAYAATYAYVNTSGEVNAVVANDPMSALLTAPNISLHSGVLLLVNLADGIVGDGVKGT